MTDRPMIFSAPMVKALLEGRKSQTRRILKSQPPEWVTRMCHEGRNGWIGSGDGHGVLMHVPYAIGDRLWVREAHAFDSVMVRYYATDDVHELRKKRSPIHMPRWASRITLTVTDVRVQRLQDVTEADAMAEGATSRPSCSGFMGRDPGWSMDWSRVGELSRFAMVPPGSPAKNPLKESDISLCDPRMAVASQWNEDHGPGAWDANPWVAAISFTVSRGNIDGGAA